MGRERLLARARANTSEQGLAYRSRVERAGCHTWAQVPWQARCRARSRMAKHLGRCTDLPEQV